jgi:dethiobiotin synthetase
VANETQADMAFADENVIALAAHPAPLLGRVPRLDDPSAEAAADIDFTQLPNWPLPNAI